MKRTEVYDTDLIEEDARSLAYRVKFANTRLDKETAMSQLRMEKSDLDNVPVVPLPEGYVLRNYREGDEAGLGRVYAASSLGCETAELVRKRVIDRPCFTPARLFVIESTARITVAW